MTKTLQQIKDEVAEGFGYKSNSVFSAHEQIVGSTYEVLSNSIDQVAIRYAQDQNKELVEMLESVVQLQKDHYGNGSRTHIALILKAKEIEKLITKHKQS